MNAEEREKVCGEVMINTARVIADLPAGSMAHVPGGEKLSLSVRLLAMDISRLAGVTANPGEKADCTGDADCTGAK